MDVPPDYFEEFKENLRSISTAVRYSAEVVPKRLAELSKELSDSFDVYRNAGAPSRPEPGPRTEGISGASSLTGTSDATARARLARGNDAYEAEMEGGASTGPQRKETWRDRVQQSGLGDVLPLPRYPGAEPNARDLLSYMSTVSANLASKRQAKLDARPPQQEMREQARELGLITQDADGNDVMHPDVQAAISAPDTKLAKLSDLFAAGEDAYAQGKYIRGIISKVTRPLQSTRALGYQTGFEGGSQGFLGFRGPDAGFFAGLKQRTSEIPFALNNNVSPGQANQIYQHLYGLGWLGGPQTNNMRTAAAQMTGANPFIAQMPQYYEMMDKATRLGASSLQHFNDVMMSVPDTAKAAHVGISQTMADMDQLGQMNKQMGGTYMGGLQNAQGFQSITGLPASVAGTLMQNPMVQAQTFLRTGLMPWEQGLATPGQHTGSMMGAIQMLGGIINPGGAVTNKIGNTGFSTTVSAQDQKEALMSHFLGISKEAVHAMLSNQRGIQAGSQIWDEGDAYRSKVTNSLRGGNLRDAYNTLTGSGKGQWGQISHDMSIAVDDQGHRMFEDWGTYNKLRKAGMGKANAHQLAQQQAISNVQHAGDKDLLKDAGGAANLAKDLKTGHWSKQMMADVARDRAKEMKRYQSDYQNRFGPGGQGSNGPKLTIELGPAAKKAFNLNDPNSQQKANRGAGAASINLNSYAQGPTQPPTPDFNTAGSSGTYDYGSQYDTGSY